MTPSTRRLTLAVALIVGISCRDDSTAPTAPAAEAEPSLATAVAALSFRLVTAGTYHSCGLTTDNRAYCWGGNAEGQLGDGTNAYRSRPSAVTGGLTFLQLSAGSNHTCGVTTDNRAFCWGYNAEGQVGDGRVSSCGFADYPPCTGINADRNRPTRVLGGLLFRQIDGGELHTCGVTTADRAYCWGNNFYSQLGEGVPSTHRSTPVPVADGRSFREVSAGSTHSCGVTYSHKAFCWGSNRHGQLGDGTAERRRSRPTLVAGGHLFAQISTGGQQLEGHTCGVTTGNRAFCWGSGRLGQIGYGGANIRQPSPRAVSGGLSIKQVSAGLLHSCGVTTENRAYCWGDNSFGGLGDGTTTRRFTPVGVKGGLSLNRVSAGGGQTCGKTTSNVAYCWGDEISLGDGTNTQRLTPVRVVGPM